MSIRANFDAFYWLSSLITRIAPNSRWMAEKAAKIYRNGSISLFQWIAAIIEREKIMIQSVFRREFAVAFIKSERQWAQSLSHRISQLAGDVQWARRWSQTPCAHILFLYRSQIGHVDYIPYRENPSFNYHVHTLWLRLLVHDYGHSFAK